jgi:hypothetical protein
MDPDHVSAHALKALQANMKSHRDKCELAAAAVKVPYLALRQQPFCQGLGCACSTLAAAVQQMKDAVVSCDADMCEFVQIHKTELKSEEGQSWLQELYADMWGNRCTAAGNLARVGQTLLLFQHTPEAQSTVAAAYNE